LNGNRPIEEFVRQHCSDIVAEAVVVGNQRPSLALLVELINAIGGQADKDLIIERMTFFNQQRYKYERLSADRIVFVGRGTLPRTAVSTSTLRPIALSFN
jgi:hypothetical protein